MTGGLDTSLDPRKRPGRLGVGVIGAGRVGAVLGAALRNAGHTVTGVHAVSEASRTRAEALLPDVPVLEVPEILRRSEMVLFAVPDDVLGELVAGLVAAGHVQAGHLLVHTSGRYGVGVMGPVRAAGAIPLAIHPAMTFTGLSLDLARLRDCVFGVTADPVVLPVAQALAVEMGGEPVVIKEADRAVYHTALSHGSNHLVTVTAQAAQLLRQIGVADTERLLRPLLSASLENALADGDGALTGPVARGDVETVRAHRDTLRELVAEGMPADVLDTWEALARATAQRAVARGALRDDVAARVLDVLGEPDED
ncbi:DUF2520 domain-containing protein [Micrococcus sp. EYE_162]|uniref:Rossmann-like and DUF2520 domain-containing protein n=1 Tax=unclassified Micrococcus TaxID=2620948 RepID=UPI002005CA79|nr:MULTISPECIES: DUF2520 domain-containing protein [unclassified Micrococcus]MCK6096411.1 DUF2520 domain-containing protein [Micrococcus sp. EYE_212]MCK6172593.1 DUF2520 domain-containing protein [Micrococcus sp. EYE_162]